MVLQGSCFKAKRILLRIVAGQKLVEEDAQAVDIRTRRCLRPAILFGSGIAGRAERNGIVQLPWLEVASNAKVDQVEMAVRGAHDIGRFEVAEDNRWLAAMQVVKHTTELNANSENFG